jgi:hypothetical protein
MELARSYWTAVQGIPYKVYATELTLAGVSLPSLVLWVATYVLFWAALYAWYGTR